MANFGITNSTVAGFGSSQAPMTAAYKTLVLAAASTQGAGVNTGNGQLRRGKIYDILVGTNGTPADQAMEFQLSRATVTTSSGTTFAGVLSSVSSAMSLDLADVGAQGFLVANSSNEGGISLLATPAPWYVGVNQRASYRWVCAPGSEIIFPAVSSATGGNGLCLQARSPTGYTGTATGGVMFQEQ